MKDRKEKRINRWKTGGTKQQSAAYLQEMAEQGLILEEMGSWMYTFCEDDPQYLRYRVEKREELLSAAERRELEADGWREVCQHELEYVFAKERDPFEEEPEIDKQKLVDEIDQQIAKSKKGDRQSYAILAFFVLFILLLRLRYQGVSSLDGDFLLANLAKWGPNLLFVFVLGWLTTHKLRKKKERILEDDIPREYMDWRISRKASRKTFLVLLVALGIAVFYAGDLNEKTRDLPTEVSYAEIPAVRLENLLDGPLTRAGGSVGSPKGEIFQAQLYGNIPNDWARAANEVDNYWVDYRYLLKTEEKVETSQYVKTEDGKSFTLEVLYQRFRSHRNAAEWYDRVIGAQEDTEEDEQRLKDVPKREPVAVESDAFLKYHICRQEWPYKISYHVVCLGEEGQVMDLNYNGYTTGKDIAPERLLEEVDKVFQAQK